MNSKYQQLSLRDAGAFDKKFQGLPLVGWAKVSSERHKAGTSRKARIRAKKERE